MGSRVSLQGLLLFLVIAACDRGADPSGGLGDSARVHHAERIEVDGPPLVATELMRIGAAEGGDGVAFGRIRGLLLDGDGAMYVLDALAREFSIFAPTGDRIRTVGRTGSGPGEYRDPRGMAWSPDSALWIMDFANQRYTVLDRRGELIATFPRAVPASGTDWEGFVDAQGRVYDVTFVRSASGVTERILVRFDVHDQRLVPMDTFPLPAQPDNNLLIEAPVGILSFGVPFAARPSWAFDGQTGLWMGDGAEYRMVRRRFAGDTVGEIVWALPPQPVSPAERREAMRELDAVIARAGGDPAQITDARIPAYRPAHGRIRVDGEGNLWVQRPPGSDDPPTDAETATTFDVFSADGGYRGAVRLAVAGGLPLAFAPGRVAGVNRDAMGVQRVVLYALSRGYQTRLERGRRHHGAGPAPAPPQ